MKIVILTASTGAGHNQAAKNLTKEFAKFNDEIKIIDIFQETTKNTNKIICQGYDVFASKLPQTYGIIYNISNNKLINPIFLKNIFFKVEKKLKIILDEIKPDIIISTHPLSVPIISKIKEDSKYTIPFIQIITDFKAHYTYIDKGVDAYITASEFTKTSLTNKGIPENKIFVYGIPIKEEFRNNNKVESDIFKILIMGGSMGLKNMEKSVDVLVNSNLNIKITVICASNIELRKKLTKKFKTKIIEGKIEVKGFVDNIDELMDSSKLLITKPGGLTSTEAINKFIPMIIPFSIPGQEEENTAFLVEEKMAISINDIQDLPKYVKMLLEDKDLYNEMVENMKNLSSSYSIEKIIELVHSYK